MLLGNKTEVANSLKRWQKKYSPDHVQSLFKNPDLQFTTVLYYFQLIRNSNLT